VYLTHPVIAPPEHEVQYPFAPVLSHQATLQFEMAVQAAQVASFLLYFPVPQSKHVLSAAFAPVQTTDPAHPVTAPQAVQALVPM